jgi:hypothetical protein
MMNPVELRLFQSAYWAAMAKTREHRVAHKYAVQPSAKEFHKHMMASTLADAKSIRDTITRYTTPPKPMRIHRPRKPATKKTFISDARWSVFKIREGVFKHAPIGGSSGAIFKDPAARMCLC